MVKPDSEGHGLGYLSLDLQPVWKTKKQKQKPHAVIGNQNFAAA